MTTERQFSQTVEISPKPPSEKQMAHDMLKYLKSRQKIEIYSFGAEAVTKKILTNLPINIVVLGDLHIGSTATDYDFIEKLKRQILSDSQTYTVCMGDIIDGFKAEYHDTLNPQFSVDEQVEIAREILLKPLADKGKILAAASDYFAHEEWAQKQAEINVWKLLVKDIDIPLLRPGGKLTIVFGDGRKTVLQLHHAARGRSKVEATYALREEAKKITVSKRPNIFFSGHIHESGTAKEFYPGSEEPLVIIASGTTKGANERLPTDKFGMKAGFGLADPLGQGVLLWKSGNNKIDAYPYENTRLGKIVDESKRVAEKIRSQGLEKEVLEEIYSNVEREPNIITDYKKFKTLEGTKKFAEFDGQRANGNGNKEKSIFNKWLYFDIDESSLTEGAGSEKTKNSKDEDSFRLAEQYQKVSYLVVTKLPIALHLISNARIGSSNEGYRELKNYISENILKNPHSLAVFLRAIIDGEVASMYQRLEVLLRARSLITPISKQSLAILLDANLRKAAWKKEIVDNSDRTIPYEKRDSSPPIAPGSYLSNATDTPLIHHKSLVQLIIGPKEARIVDRPIYVAAVMDKLEHSGSTERPTFGLMKMYKKLPEKPSFVVGGHMPNSGFSSFFDRENVFTTEPILVAPGWWASYVDTLGSGNVSEGAKPGQAIIMLPGARREDYTAIPTSNEDETKDLHNALILLYGLMELGKLDKVIKIKGRVVSKRHPNIY